MATWEDGPEYAPAERPSGFTEPSAAPLDFAPQPSPRMEPPPDRPGEYTPGGSERPLSAYHATLGPSRNPEEPFELARSTMTEVDSAWGLVHHYHVDAENWPPPGSPGRPDPREPIHTAYAGPPPDRALLPAARSDELDRRDEAVPERPGPWPAPEAPPGEPVVSFGDVFNAVTVPTFVTLLIGGLAPAVPFFAWLSPLMFILAFGSANRIEYRRNWVRNTFLVASGALGTTAVTGLVLGPGDLPVLLNLIAGVSTAACWIVLAAILVIIWQALSTGEQPQPPDPPTTHSD